MDRSALRGSRLLARGLMLALLAFAGTSRAEQQCSIPLTSGPEPKTSDCLYILRAGVELEDCLLCICDTTGNATIAASDALLCLKVAVGQNVALDCPACPVTTTVPVTTTTQPGGTTTLPPTTTSTTTTTTTTSTTLPGPPSGGCPSVVEWTTRAAFGKPCDDSGDCDAGVCDKAKGRCRTSTDLDLGWTGSGHNGDLDDGATLRVAVDCTASNAPCGQCDVTGVEPGEGSCRCGNDTRKLCSHPSDIDVDGCPACLAGAFVGDSCASNFDCDGGSCTRRCSNNFAIPCTKNNDCPGGTCPQIPLRCATGLTCALNSDCIGTCTTGSQCQCYDGAPTPLAIGGLPWCAITRLASDVSGTVNVDSGASSVTKTVKQFLYDGVSTERPCPICGGLCSNDSEVKCIVGADCGEGNICQLDPVAGDNQLAGVCVGGSSDGFPCDVQATNASFPPGAGSTTGAGYSLDCMPEPGANFSGSGLAITLHESTGTAQLDSGLSCGGASPELSCPCLVCSLDSAQPCRGDGDCSPDKGTCTGTETTSFPKPNACDGGLCSDLGGGRGVCTTGPNDRWCDGKVKASGAGYIACVDDGPCTSSAAGTCSLVERRRCFLDPIVAAGHAHGRRPITAATFCVSGKISIPRNEIAGLPGPARLRRQTNLAALCATNPSVVYKPVSGECPP